MTDEQVYQKIEEMYRTDKGKRFVSHLIHSFFPVDKTWYAFEEIPKNSKCCITRTPLISKMQAIQLHQEAIPEIMKHMKEMFKVDKDGKPSTEEHPLAKKLKGRVLAVVCDGSDKMMTAQAYGQLYNFIANKLLMGDGNINFILKRKQAKQMVKHLQDKNIVTNDKEAHVVKKRIEKPKTTTLGDLQILQDLKTKMKAAEKKE